MAAIEPGDIFIAFDSGFASFSGGMLVSGEGRALLVQVSRLGVTKDQIILNYGEQNHVKGICTDGTNLYLNIDAIEQNASIPLQVHTISVLKLEPDGTITVTPTTSGSVPPISGDIIAEMLATNGGGTFWQMTRYAVGQDHIREYDSAWALTGNTHELGGDAFWSSQFVNTNELLLCRAGGPALSPTEHYSDLYQKHMGTGTETLVYSSPQTPATRFLFGAGYRSSTGQTAIGMVQNPLVAAIQTIYQVVGGVEYYLMDFDSDEAFIQEDSGLVVSYDQENVYFTTSHIDSSTAPPRPQTQKIWAAPFATASVSEFWSDTLTSLNYDMGPVGMCMVPLTAVSGGGRRRMYTTAIGVH